MISTHTINRSSGFDSDWLRLCSIDLSGIDSTNEMVNGLPTSSTNRDCNSLWRRQIAYDVAYILAVGIFGVSYACSLSILRSLMCLIHFQFMSV